MGTLVLAVAKKGQGNFGEPRSVQRLLASLDWRVRLQPCPPSEARFARRRLPTTRRPVEHAGVPRPTFLRLHLGRNPIPPYFNAAGVERRLRIGARLPGGGSPPLSPSPTSARHGLRQRGGLLVFSSGKAATCELAIHVFASGKGGRRQGAGCESDVSGSCSRFRA